MRTHTTHAREKAKKKRLGVVLNTKVLGCCIAKTSCHESFGSPTLNASLQRQRSLYRKSWACDQMGGRIR